MMLDKRGWGPASLTFDAMEAVSLGSGGPALSGDPMPFVWAATGRGDREALGSDPSVNVDG